MTFKKTFFIPFIITLLFLPNLVWAANQLDSVRIWAAPESTRVVFDLTQAPKYDSFTLTGPDRLVVDIQDTGAKVNLDKIANNSKIIKKIRFSSPPKKGILRLVMDLTKPVKSSLFTLPPTAPYGNRLVVDLENVDGGSSTGQTVSRSANQSSRDIVVAIDAGHGGEDPGSIGPSGMHEKRVVLEIAKRLARKVDATPGMRAVMTRTGDYFVNLNKRSELARNSKADLLISIHADAFTSPQPSGASVWVLSMRRANSEIGRWLEQKEKHSELLGGAGEIIQNTDSEQYLAMTLLDMSMNSSMAISHSIAGDILRDLDTITHLHKRNPESASFAVLKSPDIPSILVETGFISNPGEERLLSNGNHQEKLANAIYKGVLRYFEGNPPADSLMAKTSNVKHSVKRGESLSIIAQRYSVSVSSIKQANNLKSDVVRIGQKLVIPRA
ncbi:MULTISPECIES: N-acetylmuramoyl-L-alanine amidase [Shewanella]|uniref:N-acetylmuramoyl-L-alanine amidase n=1 Tax=Shewanella TaxID=22 RepID=UPI000C667F87|nr:MULTISPECIES: N-acetylmuramoyl-L-alanine amidase [Shewanella]NCQ45395.1 AMIN domain-containing protein [Shewanella frigidimarina]MBB1320910.1 N-acetylmuramoyl-L-alanine amidase [Shewanella sp. SR43-8]NCO71454.1 AMIN domain-containing protein [Shewanella vesiculosa]NCP36734.1 AMIN domain-containing protein [Shewanella vesiculosa]NCP69173.1 AMIN domain-containing protein [Shewanella vesiculosa]|tara:strand:- start:3033 stop:4358 length:1326 start_codon:yes stop_codon:yes gene_type:complete